MTDVPVILPGDPGVGLPYGTDHDRVEYGYQTPDGELHWGYPMPYSPNPAELATATGQANAQSRFEAAIRALGVEVDPEEHALVFLQRAEQLRYTEPSPLTPPDPEEEPTEPEEEPS